MPSQEPKPNNADSEEDKPEERATAAEVHAAIERYSEIAEQRLKPGLDAVCEHRDKLFANLERLDTQKHALENLRVAGSTTKTRANIGEEFYVAAEVNLLKPIVLELSEGLMVEVSIDEACKMIQERKELLEHLSTNATTRIVNIQAHLKAVLATVAKLRESHGALLRQEERGALLGDERW